LWACNWNYSTRTQPCERHNQYHQIEKKIHKFLSLMNDNRNIWFLFSWVFVWMICLKMNTNEEICKWKWFWDHLIDLEHLENVVCTLQVVVEQSEVTFHEEVVVLSENYSPTISNNKTPNQQNAVFFVISIENYRVWYVPKSDKQTTERNNIWSVPIFPNSWPWSERTMKWKCRVR
jgi:hypothetical protein